MKYISILLVILCSSAFAQTTLNGISPYEVLNKEYYIGALYLPEESTDASAILSDERAQKMVIKVTARRWSQRKFSEFWRQDLALNNDMGANQALTALMLSFTNFPQQSLSTGDELVFQYAPSTGSEVLLNNEVVFKSAGKGLYNALMRTWIGEVPHSRHFQTQILGHNTDIGARKEDLIARFEASSIQADRANLYSGWKAAEEAARQAIAQAEAEAEARREREREQARQAAAEQSRLEEERRQAEALAAQRRREAEAAQQEEQDQEKVAAAIAAQEEAERRAAELAAQQAQEEESLREQQQRSAANQYAVDLYRWEVLRDVYKRVSYPEWARQFEQEGVVTIEFAVNSQGQLLGVSGVQPADAGLLGQELREAVTRAAPFNPFPAQISENQLRVVIDYEFTLEERVAEVPEAPVAPDGVGGDEELTNVQKAVGWAKYKDSVKAELEASIEYPFWARDLKQEGLVTAEVTVRNDGTIARVKIKKRARHNILNQEVEQAMDRVGSVASFPSWVEDDTLTVLIEHDFKL